MVTPNSVIDAMAAAMQRKSVCEAKLKQTEERLAAGVRVAETAHANAITIVAAMNQNMVNLDEAKNNLSNANARLDKGRACIEQCKSNLENLALKKMANDAKKQDLIQRREVNTAKKEEALRRQQELMKQLADLKAAAGHTPPVSVISSPQA